MAATEESLHLPLPATAESTKSCKVQNTGKLYFEAASYTQGKEVWPKLWTGPAQKGQMVSASTGQSLEPFGVLNVSRRRSREIDCTSGDVQPGRLLGGLTD